MSAQVPQAEISISGWRLECDSLGGALQCHLLDQVTARGNNAVISAITIRRQSAANAPVMVVQVPLGIAVDNAVRVGFENGAVQTLPFFTCNRNGCFARAQVGEPVLSAMRAAKQPFRIAYETLDANGEKQTVTITLGLDGFSSAYDRLR
jgi:invasion protein IalB